MPYEGLDDEQLLPMITRREALTTTAGGLFAFSLSTTTATAQQDDRLQWEFPTDGSITRSPTVVDGTVFVGSENILYAINPDTGAQEWSFDTAESLTGSGVGPPMIADGTIFMGSLSGNFYAVDAKTGEQQWAFYTDSEIYSKPAVSDDTVFFDDFDDKLYALDIATGEQQWTFEASGSVRDPNVVDESIIFGGGNNLYAVNAETGEQRWVFETNDSVSTDLLLVNETVYFGSQDSTLYAVNVNTGEQEWGFKTGDVVGSAPVVGDETVFLGSTDNNLYAINIDTGEQRWAVETGDAIGTSPIISNGTVFIGSYDDNLYAVDIGTGEQQWTFETDDNISSSPTVAGGTVFVGSQDGNLYAVDADTGEQQWVFATVGSIISSPTVVDGTIFIGDDSGSLYSVDATVDVATSPTADTTDAGSSGGSADSDGASLTNIILTVTLGGAILSGTGYGAYRMVSRYGDRMDFSNLWETMSVESNSKIDSESTRLRPDRQQTSEEGQNTSETTSQNAVDGGENRTNGAISDQNTDSLITDPVHSWPDISVSYDDIEKGDPIGSGGNADVYQARATTESDGITLAIKEPRMNGTIDTETIDQLIDEAERWQQLDDHDHIVSVIDYGSNPLPWIAMKYMDGGDLSQRAEGLDFEQALWTALAIAEGIRHAHKNGVIHLDLKPENILFRSVEDAWDVPKVADWGLSKQLLKHSKSVDGMSPHYAAPEQFDTDTYGQTNNVTDVYQLGAVFYELFTGRPPFEGQTFEVIDKIRNEEPTPPSQVADVPAEIDDIILTALATEQTDRYADVIYIRDKLQEIWEEYE